MIDWEEISRYISLSENIIREFADKVRWSYISEYQKLSEDFIREFAKEFGIKINNNSQRTTDEWKQIIKSTGLYECHEDYFIAYKGIRSDRYSKFNFQYQYLPGETYECFSDYSDDKCSFGLSAWTKKKATEYCSELTITVKIYYSDVTAVVGNIEKIRCKKLTVLD